LPDQAEALRAGPDGVRVCQLESEQVCFEIS